jgi:hypothetical protein
VALSWWVWCLPALAGDPARQVLPAPYDVLGLPAGEVEGCPESCTVRYPVAGAPVPPDPAWAPPGWRALPALATDDPGFSSRTWAKTPFTITASWSASGDGFVLLWLRRDAPAGDSVPLSAPWLGMKLPADAIVTRSDAQRLGASWVGRTSAEVGMVAALQAQGWTACSTQAPGTKVYFRREDQLLEFGESLFEPLLRAEFEWIPRVAMTPEWAAMQLPVNTGRVVVSRPEALQVKFLPGADAATLAGPVEAALRAQGWVAKGAFLTSRDEVQGSSSYVIEGVLHQSALSLGVFTHHGVSDLIVGYLPEPAAP